MQKPFAVVVGVAALLLSVVLGITQCTSSSPTPQPADTPMMSRMASPIPAGGSTVPNASMLSRMMPAVPMTTTDAGTVVDAGVVMNDAGVLAPTLPLQPTFNPASKSGFAIPMPTQQQPGNGSAGLGTLTK
jgi:FlaG/FlaF family flagellin (archaellin)